MNPPGYADLLNESIIEAGSLIVGTLNLPNLDPNSATYIDSSNNLADRILTNGQLLIGSTGNAPVGASITGTTDEVIVTNGPGSITLSTPQPIATTSDPTFRNLTVTTINGKVGNDLVTGPASAGTDQLATYNGTTGKVIKDSLINSADVFLRTGTVAATGNFNMNGNELQNVAAIRPSNTNIIIGTAASAFNSSNIVVGNSSSVSNSSSCIVVGNADSLQFNCNDGIAIGDSLTLLPFGGMDQSVYVGNNITSSGGARNVIVGKGSSNNTGSDNVILGQGSSISSGTQNVIVGGNTTMSGNGGVSVGYGNTMGASSVSVGAGNVCTATRAHSLGLNVSNATANSFLIDARTNVRCDVDNMTDLGTSTNYWKDGYFKGSLIGGTNTRTVDNIVSNAGTGTSGRVVSFSGASGKIITDSSTPNIGTPSAGTLTNCTGLPISTGVSGLGANVATMLGTFSSANIRTACTDETGSGGSLVFATSPTLSSPTLVTPALGTPASGTLTNCTGLPISTGVSGLGTNVATMLATFSSANIKTACTDETGSGGSLVFATSPTITTPSLVGVTDASSATAGNYGEVISGSATGVSFTTTVVRDITSVSLTAGDWDCYASAQFTAGGSNMSVIAASLSTTSATHNTGSTAFTQLNLNIFNAGTQALAVGMLRVNVSSTTTLYLTGQSNFTTSFVTGAGYITCRRVR